MRCEYVVLNVPPDIRNVLNISNCNAVLLILVGVNIRKPNI